MSGTDIVLCLVGLMVVVDFLNMRRVYKAAKKDKEQVDVMLRRLRLHAMYPRADASRGPRGPAMTTIIHTRFWCLECDHVMTVAHVDSEDPPTCECPACKVLMLPVDAEEDEMNEERGDIRLGLIGAIARGDEPKFDAGGCDIQEAAQ